MHMRAMRFADNYNDVQDCSKENVGIRCVEFGCVQKPDNTQIACTRA